MSADQSLGMENNAAAPVSLTHRQVMVIFGALMLAMLLAALDQTIVSTALPTIVGDLGGLSQLSWVVTGYILTSTVSSPIYGKIGDLYGRKTIFQAAIVLFLIGSALSGLSQNMTELIGFRALQGLGAGGLMVGAQSIIADIVSPRERGRYQRRLDGLDGDGVPPQLIEGLRRRYRQRVDQLEEYGQLLGSDQVEESPEFQRVVLDLLQSERTELERLTEQDGVSPAVASRAIRDLHLAESDGVQ